MRIRTDDDVYRVDAVWLGPPKATFPWRARYVAWGVGVVVYLLVLTVLRQMLAFGWAAAWSMVGTVLITRFVTSRINHERPLGAVLTMWVRELTAPRETVAGNGGAVSATRVRVRSQRPRPKSKQRRGSRRDATVRRRGGVPAKAAGRQGVRSRREVGGVRTPT